MPVDEPNSSIAELLALAQSAHVQGRLPDAENFARQVLVDDPKNLSARLVLGVVLAKQRKLPESYGLLEGVARDDASCYQSRLWISRIARKAGQTEESMEYGAQALALDPKNPEALINFGLTLIDAHEYGAAAQTLRQAAELAPNSAGVFLHLGIAEQRRGRLPEAYAALQRALEIDARLPDVQLAIGQLLLAAGNPTGAGAAASQALSLNPKSTAAQEVLIEALVEANRGVEAAEQATRYVVANPANSTAFCMLGKCLLSLGKTNGAIDALEKSIALQPVQGTAYCLIAQSNQAAAENPTLLARMEATLTTGGLPLREESYLRYGLGKRYEDLARYAEAMPQFDEANRLAYALKFDAGELDRDAYAAQVQWAIDTFDAAFLGRFEGIGNSSNTPIFIVGMIRSGTTLVEQILSSHPLVGAGGEQRFWQARWGDAFPSGDGKLEPERLNALGEAYLGVLGQIETGKPRITDKLPGNYTRLGLLHLAFPNARIIHTRRHPVDTCISIYTTPNSAPNEFTHDKSNIVFGYREYLRLMAHWRSVLPANRMFEIDYEALIADRKNLTRQLVAFCGLDWSDACLRPEESLRAISTPSAVQARKPVYSSSVGRWRRYEHSLGAFAELLTTADSEPVTGMGRRPMPP